MIIAMLLAASISVPPEMLSECRRHPDTSCVWITGSLVPPPALDAGPDMCRRIDPKTGKIAASWQVRQKLHVFWNENIFHSGYFMACD